MFDCCESWQAAIQLPANFHSNQTTPWIYLIALFYQHITLYISKTHLCVATFIVAWELC